jgi:tRNA threonylcarbamoyladenosine biosynthesis protein TsaE
MAEARAAVEFPELDLPDEAATNALAAALARLARATDVFALSGELGTGKTTFARAFIDARGGGEEVPSPTFTLVQVYEVANGAVYHFDLFRLANPGDAFELGTEDAFAEGISLIEWPERLGPHLPAERLDVAFAYGAAVTSRKVRLTGHGTWKSRLENAGLV